MLRKTKKFDWYKARQRFAIRTYHFGAASVLLGMSLVAGAQSVSATEVLSETMISNTVVAETGTEEASSQSDQSIVTVESASPVVSEEVAADTIAPVTPVILTDLTGKAGQAVAVIVSAEAGSNVALYDADGQLLGNGTADASGQAIIILTLSQTETSLTALATDQAGNVSETSEAVQVTALATRAETSTVVTPSVETVVATLHAPTAVEEARKVLEQVASEAAVLASEGERLVATTETTNTVLQTAVEDARMVASQSEQVLVDSWATLEELTAQVDAVRSRVEVLAVELRKFSPDGLITAKLDASAPENPTNVMADSKGIKSVTSQYIGKDSEGLDMVKWTITHDSKPGRHWQFILIATSDKFNNTSTSDINVTNGSTYNGSAALRIYDYQERLGYINYSPLRSYFGTENGSGFYTNEKPGPGAGANRAILWDDSWRNESQSDYVIEVITHGPNHTLYVRSASSTLQVRTEALLRYPSETGNTDWDDTLAALPEDQRTGANKIVNNDGFLKAPIVKYPSVVANDGGSVTVTPSREAGDDANRVEFSYTDESNVEHNVTITKDSNGNWSVPASSGLTADPTTGAVTVPADSVKDGSTVSATAKDIANNQAGPVTAIAKNDPAPANTPTTATNPKPLYIFKDTAIKTVDSGSNVDTITTDDKVNVVTLQDPEGIKTVVVSRESDVGTAVFNPASIGITIDTTGNATGTTDKPAGVYSRGLTVTDNKDNVTNLFPRNNELHNYVFDATAGATITKQVGVAVTETEILDNVTVATGNADTMDSAINTRYRKVLKPGETVPTTPGTHTVTVRVITDSNVYKDVVVTVVIPENPPATATDKQTVYVFNNTAIKTVDPSTKAPNNVDKVKIATISDPQGIKSVTVGGGSLGYEVDTSGNATGTPSVTDLGYYSRSLVITDNVDQVTTVFANGTDRYNTHIMDATVTGEVTKAVGEAVTEAEILAKVNVNTGNSGNYIADPTAMYEKILAPGQTVPTTPGRHEVTVRVITDSNVYKDLVVVVNIPKAITDSYTPTYAEKLVVPGTPATSIPTFTDANGTATTAPAGATYEISADFQVPAGYIATIDSNTGAVTVTVSDGTTVNSITVPVKVTYSDGTVDNATAVFKLDTDNDGIPDVTDTDDDNDGIPDTQDANPKTANPTVITADDATVTEG
ncbi:YPDG domain-containing protein, partial [Streptococcus suis]|uniref:YPDG domain-containing protein n=1 Tax=Streptococcus suis TaxID=1307 RepID=UPI0037D28B16